MANKDVYKKLELKIFKFCLAEIFVKTEIHDKRRRGSDFDECLHTLMIKLGLNNVF